MSTVNYRVVADRFTHIDAEFVRARCDLGDDRAEYTVRLYPWWEHPLYLKARETDGRWGFSDVDECAKHVTVAVVNPFAFRLSKRTEVIDWGFYEDHPFLWEYQDEGQIFCNAEVDHRVLLERLLDRKIPFVDRGLLLRWIDPQQGQKAPYSLPHLLCTLFGHVRAVLEEMDAPVFIPREPEAREVGTAFLIDGDDYILAEDFTLDVPDFEHKPEIFDPSLDKR